MPHNKQTHPLFPNYGYELRMKPDNLYLGGVEAPIADQLDPEMGVFYVNMDGENLSYTVKDPAGAIVTSHISLQEMKDALGEDMFFWPNPFSPDNLKPLLNQIWSITADRKHTLKNPVYIADRTTQFPSDHLPISGHAGDIHLVSWNTMGMGSTNFSAFRFDEFKSIFNEKRELVPQDTSYADARYRHIIKILGKIDDKNLIHLQETNIDTAELQAMLGDTWVIVDSVTVKERNDAEKKDATKNRVVTCYRRDLFNQLEVEDNTCADNGDRYLKLVLENKATGLITDCYNVWTVYNDFPEVHEKFYQQKIEAGKALGHDVIIAGDTNTRMRPVSEAQYNITTGLIPPSYLKENAAYNADNTLMIPDFPDGMIHYNHQNKTIVQSEIHVLDTNGEIFPKEAPSPENWSEAEQIMRTEYRAVLSLDALGANTEDNHLLVLQNLFGAIMDEDIAIRVAVNSINQRGVAVRFPSAASTAYAAVKQELQSQNVPLQATPPYVNQLTRIYQELQPQPVIIVAEENKVQLLSAIVKVANQTVMKDISSSISTRFQPRIDKLTKLNEKAGTLSSMKIILLNKLTTALQAGDVERYKDILAEWKQKEVQVTIRHWFKADEVKTISYFDCIKKHRSTFFAFGKTASESLIDQLENDIEQVQSQFVKP